MEESTYSESLTALSILTIAMFIDNALQNSILPQSQFDKLAEPCCYNVMLAPILKDTAVKTWMSFLSIATPGK